jgi:cation diffusion facilitator CzcD-associated flavoprotein CzcO
VIRYLNAKELPEGYPVDKHFNPDYKPWDQRLCMVPVCGPRRCWI